MSLATDMALAAAQMIAQNEGRSEPCELDHAHAQWAIAGIVRAWQDRKEQHQGQPSQPPAAPPVQATGVGDGGGNVHERGPTALGGPPNVLREISQAKGYTGDACKDCGNFTLVRNGTCLKCDSCGSTTGCS